MSRILKVNNSNYRLQVQGGGTITLDVGSVASGGTVVITGNLDVKGVQTVIESTTTTVADNIIELNVGSTGSGISSVFNYQGGVQILRGNNVSYPAAQMLFNEQIGFIDNTNGSGSVTTNGGFLLTTTNNTVQGVKVSKIASRGGNGVSNDLVFDLQGGTTALRVSNYNTTGSNSYINSVTLPDHIPTFATVQLFCASNYVPGSGVQGQAIVSEIKYPVTGSPTAKVTATSNTLTYFVGTTNLAVSTPTGTATAGYVSANNIEIGANGAPNTITSISTGDPRHVTSANNNLILASTTGLVEVSGVLQLDDQTAPTYAANMTKLYSGATSGPGGTGVFVTNSTVQTPDELVSRKRAVLLSILL
jgi:hypothetical protein